MREILFRGKRKDNGEWVYGDLLNVGVDYDYAIRTYGGREHGQVNAVNENTVGQYTGLPDKNGKKIFEGDIVKYKKYATRRSNNVYVVKYDTEIATFIGEKYSQIHGTSFTTFENDSEFIEVIGNIHDNPELLKGETKNER